MVNGYRQFCLSIRNFSKLHLWMKRLSVKTRAGLHEVNHPILPDRQRKKFLENDPLVMPGHLTAGLVEPLWPRTSGLGGIGAQSINYDFVKP